jgi:argininosuccinate lyase
MTDPLWQKQGIRIDPRIMQFLAGNDVLLDREFFLHDIRASKAHVEGLANIGVIDAGEALALARELDVLADDFSAGRFVLDDTTARCRCV